MEVKEFDVVKLKNGMTGTIVDVCSKDVCMIELDSEFIIDDVWFMFIRDLTRKLPALAGDESFLIDRN